MKLLKDVRTYFMILLWISIGFFCVQLMQYPILPDKYMVVVFCVLGLLGLLLSFAQYKTKKLMRLLGKLCIVVLSGVLLFVNFTYIKAIGVLYTFTEQQQVDVVAVLVKADSEYEEIDDLIGTNYGVVENADVYVENSLIKISEINDERRMDIHRYTGYTNLVNAFYNGEVDSMIINESFIPSIEEMFETFREDTKVVYFEQFQSDAPITLRTREFDITQDTFSVFISGIDTYGSVSTKSRSDVNILVTVDPYEKKVLLTHIPRDYYIPFNCLDGQKDKITHSGLYGVQESMLNVANFFGVEPDYYVKVNFDSVIKIVNAIGGIEVYNPQSFLRFPSGNITLYGEDALLFARERYSFAGGDRERGRNQMRVITGIIQKICSPAIINNAFDLLESLKSSFTTNMSDEEMLELVRMQLDDMATWSIESISVNGYGITEYSPVYGDYCYMMVPEEASVNIAKEMIQKMYPEN